MERTAASLSAAGLGADMSPLDRTRRHGRPVTRPAELFGQPEAMTNYICHWSPARRYIYVETPKVACTTVKRVLQAADLPAGAATGPARDVHDRALSPLLSPRADPGGFLAAMEDPACFRFAFVRNPFTRALSCWLDKFVTNDYERRRLAPLLGLDPGTVPAFADVLAAIAAQPEEARDPHWATQSYLLRPGWVSYSFLGRFEAFRPQFLKVCETLGIAEHAADLTGTWHATGADGKLATHFGPREADLVRHIYEEDFRNFGYGWDPRVV